jgi:hypothetical protein
MLSLAQSGRPVLGGDLAARLNHISLPLELSKNIALLKCLVPKTIFGQVFGARAKTKFGNPKAPRAVSQGK